MKIGPKIRLVIIVMIGILAYLAITFEIHNVERLHVLYAFKDDVTRHPDKIELYQLSPPEMNGKYFHIDPFDPKRLASKTNGIKQRGSPRLG